MGRQLKAMLAGILCLSCLMAPLSASAKVYNEEIVCTEDDKFTEFNVTLEADAFRYTGRYRYYTQSKDDSYYGRLETDVTNANCIITGVSYDGDTTEPICYTINGLTSPSFGFLTGVSARQMNECLDGKALKVGDLLYIDPKTVTFDLSWPEGINLNPTLSNGETIESIVEYAGNGMDIFGEDFKKILRYELYAGSIGSSRAYNDLPVDKGMVDSNDTIDLLDVIAVNRYLMIGEPIGFYGQLCADVNNDGQVTSTDALHILRKVVGLIDSFEEVQN